jgi:plasmid replication initiation protein
MSKISNSKKLTVVHSNDLLEAGYGHSIDEMRLLSLALTKIDSRKKNPGKIDIYPSEFSKMFDLNSDNVWRDMKNAIDKLIKNPVKIYRLDSAGKEKTIKKPWLIESEYYTNQEDGTRITIEFSPKITPYLFELKNRFTSLNFESLSQLTTSFSYRLYSWLMKSKNMKNDQEGGTVAVELDLAWMKERADLKGQYVRWVNFRDRVIQPAVDHINAKTDISLIWTPIKNGRAVSAICFNYIFEESTFIKPIRPRLKRRPKVTAGSHDEGVWMRHNMGLLITFEEELFKYDPEGKIALDDLRKIVNYANKTGQSSLHDKYKNKLEVRNAKNKAR